MKTYVFEGVVTALSSLSHGGGESMGITSKLRREKFVQPNGKVEEVPIISGNAIRGILRDTGMAHMCACLGYGEDGAGLPLQAYYLLFSGGALVKEGSGLDVEYARKLRNYIPLIGVFGGAIGNMIMPGKMKVGKLLPLCKETNHLLPESKRGDYNSVWEFCQEEMYTRRDDEKNENIRGYIAESDRKLIAGDKSQKAELSKSESSQQMMYYVETISAGTRFYWKLVFEDLTDIEYDAVATMLAQFSKAPYIGGKSAVGHGEIGMKMDNWMEIDSRVSPDAKEIDRPIGTKYQQHLESKRAEIQQILEGFG